MMPFVADSRGGFVETRKDWLQNWTGWRHSNWYVELDLDSKYLQSLMASKKNDGNIFVTHGDRVFGTIKLELKNN